MPKTLTNIFNSFLKVFSLFVILFVGFTLFANSSNIVINAQNAQVKNEGASITNLQISNITCIFYQKNSTIKGCTEKNSLLAVILKFLQDIAPFVTVILIIIGGYEYFVDDAAKKTTAKSTIFSAISGYIVILLAQPIANIVEATFTGTKENPIDPTALTNLFRSIIEILINLSSIVAVVCIVLAGYAYFLEFFVNSGKQEGKLRGQDLLSAGILGLIVTTLARPIVGFITATLTSNGTDIKINSDNITTVVKNILANFLIPLSTLVALVFIVASAYLWLTAGDSEEKVKNAKKFLTNALIGLVIVLLSTVIVQLITYFAAPGASFLPGDANSTTIYKGPDALNTNTTKPTINPINKPVVK